MLHDLIDPEHLRKFRQALYNLEEFEILGLSWEIDKDNRVISPYNLTETVDRWGDLGFIDDWYLERIHRRSKIGLLPCPLPVVYTVREGNRKLAYIV